MTVGSSVQRDFLHNMYNFDLNEKIYLLTYKITQYYNKKLQQNVADQTVHEYSVVTEVLSLISRSKFM